MSDWAAKVLAGVPRRFIRGAEYVPINHALAALAKLGAGDGLVERLLARQVFLEQEWAGTTWRDVLGPDPLTSEAAAHIAALKAQLAEKEEQLVSVLRREAATHERHDAKMEAAEAECDAMRAKVARLEGAIDYILDGMAISAPEYAIDPDDDFLDAANADWVRDTLSRLAAALTDGGKDGWRRHDPARAEALLKRAAQMAYEVWDDPEALSKAILAMIPETKP